MFGYSADEIVGDNVRRLIPPERRHEEDAIVARLLRGETVRHYQSVRQRRDGSTFPVSLTVSPIRDGAGRIVGASKILRDISAQEQAQQRIAALLRTAIVLSGINSLIVRVQDQDTLLRRACALAVEQGRFRAAWIGL